MYVSAEGRESHRTQQMAPVQGLSRVIVRFSGRAEGTKEIFCICWRFADSFRQELQEPLGAEVII